jgi:hypothetical protein
MGTRSAFSLARSVVALAAVFGAACGAATASAQDEADTISPTETMQIGDLPRLQDPADATMPPPSAYLDQTPGASEPPARKAPQPALDQISGPRGNMPTMQVSADDAGALGLSQLSGVELSSSLAQLSEAERQVLFEAIEGTDICDNPPDAAAIVALCRTRLETRSEDFAKAEPRELSAEEQLISNNIETDIAPSLAQIIERLSRTKVAPDDFGNQAIASVALGGMSAPQSEPTPQDDPSGLEGFAPGTQELINAIITQLTGGAGQ